MQDRKTLGEYAKTVGFNLGQTERDYLQHIILLAVSENTGDQMVFKGGTSLQKTINMPRYSEDLDFTARKINANNLCERIREKIRYYGYENQYKKIKPITGETIKFRIRGPLYNGEAVSEATVRLDISEREDVILSPKTQTVNPIYDDIPGYTINTMNEREMLAEKIRAIVKRNQPRDLYDIHYLLNKKVGLDKKLAEEKLGYYNEKLDLGKIENSIKNIKNSWSREMNRLTRSPPEYGDVAGFVLKKLKKELS